jgi:hypothetical protein
LSSSDSILRSGVTGGLGAIRATVTTVDGLDAVADDSAPAMKANWSQLVNRAFKAIKDEALSTIDDFERLVVVVVARCALSHRQMLLGGRTPRSRVRRLR